MRFRTVDRERSVVGNSLNGEGGGLLAPTGLVRSPGGGLDFALAGCPSEVSHSLGFSSDANSQAHLINSSGPLPVTVRPSTTISLKGSGDIAVYLTVLVIEARGYGDRAGASVIRSHHAVKHERC